MVSIADIDECQEQNIKCGPNKRCFNRRGDFACVDTTCPPNYERDQQTGYQLTADILFKHLKELRTLASTLSIVNVKFLFCTINSALYV